MVGGSHLLKRARKLVLILRLLCGVLWVRERTIIVKDSAGVAMVIVIEIRMTLMYRHIYQFLHHVCTRTLMLIVKAKAQTVLDIRGGPLQSFCVDRPRART